MNDKEVIILFSGILGVIVLVKILKFIIKQERPNKTRGYGMPSTRASITSFILFYIIFTYNLKSSTKILLFIITGIIIFLKYILREHSPLQLFIGSILGIIVAYLCSLI